ncbi:sulfur oxidation c-type cytochrome SoxX [Aliarcobacter vitoriensis]|uniref:sulfur oxidation c-type cytochrome SoxX n=1 Tax=Aliarcobacter vitoriensis TaxID=2011099 RepID=UPI003AABCB1D
MTLIKKYVTVLSISSFLALNSFALDSDLIKKGEEIFNTNTKGNCLACHDANGKELDGPGNMGPKLQFLALWPEEVLYDKIFDPSTTNPTTSMPAFGRNGWLSDDEIKAVVAYIKTIN